MVKVILRLEEIMGMVLMKENKSNTMMNYGNYVRTTIVNDGNSIKTTTINGNFAMITINIGNFAETIIDNAKSVNIARQGEELDLIVN